MADVQIAVIDQQNTEVTIAVPGVQGPVGATGDVAIAQDGTAALPGIRFENDTNTGIYRPGADQVAISTNGTGRLFVDANGNVNVGTTFAGLFNGGGMEIQRSTTATLRLTGSYGVGCEFYNTGTLASIQTRSTIPFTIQTNELERLRITSDGKLGLGTSSPSNGFQVTQDISRSSPPAAGASGHEVALGSSGYGIVAGTTTGGSSYIASTRWDGSATNYNLLLQPNGGNVGIGITSPSHVLDVSGGNIRLASDNSALIFRNSYQSITTDSAGNDLTYRTYQSHIWKNVTSLGSVSDGTERMRIDSSGRLLVGTSSTSGNITNQDKLAVVITGNDTQGGLSVTNYAGTSATIGSNACLRLQRSNGVTDGSFTALSASAWGLGRIEFNGSNGSGFGTGATIEGMADTAAWSSGDHPARLVFSTTADGASSPTEAVRVTSSQDLMLAQSGSGIFVGTTTDGAYRIGKSSFAVSTGTLYIGNAAIQVSSDVRLKENIEDTSLDALDAISKIAVKDFTWNDPTDTSYNNRNARGKWTGLIAQELVDVLSFVVNAPRKEEDGSIDHESESLWTLDQSQLCPVLIKAIQQQQEIIVSLEARLSALEAQ